MNNPLAVAVKGKGLPNLLKRSLAIGRRYGLTSARMDRQLGIFTRVLEAFDCGATFPLTASTLARSRGRLEKYQDQGIEFAIHGYHHVDYSQLSLDQQTEHMIQARQAFEGDHLRCSGFRCPYLRWSPDTLKALSALGFSYDSSQALAWSVVDDFDTEAYRQALGFYRARSADDYPSLPRLTDGLLRIPYSLPDDEALVERFRLAEAGPMADLWLKVLQRSHELGEMFTLGLHPERITLCREALRAVLAKARSLSPSVWIARLDEIADWWRARAETTYRVTEAGEGSSRVTVDGPRGAVVLARGLSVQAPTQPWNRGYRRVQANDFVFQADRLPLIGVSPGSPDSLVSFLRQQGYLTARVADARSYAFYLDRTDFAAEDERPLLAQLEQETSPLIRLARWPDGTQSALSITGDIDAFTLWDFFLRAFIS